MGMLTQEMKRLVNEQRLGFCATVCEDGSPNVSPKGTMAVLDDDRLLFADIRSPQTVANVRRGSLLEINVVNPLTRRGYRFKGPGSVHEVDSELGERAVALLREAGSTQLARIRALVVVEVRQVRPLVSPAYDGGGVTEQEVAQLFFERFARQLGGRAITRR